ncbi:MAG: DUF6522 family protein [Pseudomonadota bacterium]
MSVEITDTEVTVPAETLAALFGIPEHTLREVMRTGDMTGRFEKGVDEDEGNYRLTFRYAGRRLRLTCDRAGNITRVGRTVLVGRTNLLREAG